GFSCYAGRTDHARRPARQSAHADDPPDRPHGARGGTGPAGPQLLEHQARRPVVGAELWALVRAAGPDAGLRADGAPAQAGRLVAASIQPAAVGAQDAAAHARPAGVDEGLSRRAAD